jgi:hypothetical protein
MQSFFTFLTNPLGTTSGGPSAWNLFLFIGLVLVLLAAWGLIFAHIRAAI